MAGCDPKDYFYRVDSHFTFEGHMPELVSFSFVEKIAFPVDDYKKLTKPEKTRLKTLMKNGKQDIIKYQKNPDPKITLQTIYSNNQDLGRLRKPKVPGFYFAIEKKFGDMVIIPQKLKGSKRIEFFAAGYDIHISLSKSNQNTKNLNKQGEFLHLIINDCYSYRRDGAREDPKITIASTNSVDKKRATSQTILLNEEVINPSLDTYFKYELFLDYKDENQKKKLILMLVINQDIGETLHQSSALGNQVIEYTIDSSSPLFVQPIQYVSFSCWQRPVSIKKLIFV